jgi:cellulose 1,4-beta-cellobiosidase
MLLRSSRRGRALFALAGVGAVVAAVIVAIPTTAHAAVVCNVTYQANTWTESPGAGGFTANITINNLQDPVNGWTLQFTLPSGQTRNGDGWSANWTGTSGAITATNMPWNGSLATGGSTQIGFNGRWTGSFSAPTSFTLNGVACNGGGGPTTSPPPTPTIIASPTSATVVGGASTTINIRRNAAPTANVPVSISRTGSTVVTCPTSVTLTPANWQTGVNITCSAATGTTAATSNFTAAATGHTSATFAITRSSGGNQPGRADNPFANAGVYVNSQWRTNALSVSGGNRIANQPTGVWLDRISAIEGNNSPTTGTMGLEDHLNEAVAQDAANGATPMVIQIVIYNLPGRDCAALASNGELGQTELPRYQTDYIDPIASIMARPAYANLRIVTIIEIDSLPNLVTNVGGRATATPQCNTMLANGNYVNGVGYALARLGAIPNVYNYIDAAHHGWIGWDDNFGPTAQILFQAANANGAVPANVHGFITNTANTSALQEPFIQVNEQTRPSRWIDFNRYNDELSFAQAFRQRLDEVGFASDIGMLIDTSRNGWGGPNRPTAASTATDLNQRIDASRVDRRIHKGNWCNPSGAGIGERPRANPAPGIDAYVWIKPPGESDGSSQFIENDEGKGFDRMCDPTYTGNPRNNNNMTGALPNAPLSGHWFPAQFQQLMANAFPPL